MRPSEVARVRPEEEHMINGTHHLNETCQQRDRICDSERSKTVKDGRRYSSSFIVGTLTDSN